MIFIPINYIIKTEACQHGEGDSRLPIVTVFTNLCPIFAKVCDISIKRGGATTEEGGDKKRPSVIGKSGAT